MGDPNAYDIPGDNADYNTWDFRQILHVFTGQSEAYQSASDHDSVPDPQSLFRAAAAIGDTGAAIADTHQSVNHLIYQVNRGDWWAGPTADGFSQMLSQANSVLMEHADALYNHQNSFNNAGAALSQARENVLTMWERACAALQQWWNGLTDTQRRNYEFGKWPYMTREHLPPVEVRGDTTYYRVGDFPTIADPLTQSMRDQLNQLATVYRTEIANTQTLEDVNLTGGGLGGAGGPNLGNVPPPNLPPPPDANDLLKNLNSGGGDGTGGGDNLGDLFKRLGVGDGTGGSGGGGAGGALPPPPTLGDLGQGGPGGAGGALPPPPTLGDLGQGGGDLGAAGGGLGGAGAPLGFDAGAGLGSGAGEGPGAVGGAGGALPPPPTLSDLGGEGLGGAGGAAGVLGPAGADAARGGGGAALGGTSDPGMVQMPMLMPMSPRTSSSIARSAQLPAGPGLDFSDLGPAGLPTGRIGAPSGSPKTSVIKPPTFAGLEDTAVPGPSSFARSAKTDPLQQEFADLLGKDPKVAALAAARQKAGTGALGEAGLPSSPRFSGGAGALGARTAAAEAGASTLAARTAAAEAGVAGRLAGAAGAAGPAGPYGGGMPYMPPMGGMGQGQRPGGAGERERTTWLLEDEDVWGATERDAADGVIGRPTQR
ncbi:WXG100 family type VII secretion target [Kitasatospora sp. NPDC085879]|uniref:WXG100 family type VII secretion target n=1 Tax=Kitasatospora sp. NPDC085879 TaxID=3154769 RepID=UPI00341EB2A5